MEEEDDKNAPRRQRVTPADVVARKAAKDLIAPLQEQIGHWQAETIKLETMAQRPGGKRDRKLGETARHVLDAVSKRAAEFDAHIAQIPDVIRTHSRVVDARKVLQMLEERLQRTIGSLDE
jgi:hypothetical protein